MADLDLDYLDEQRLGFAALTPEERADIISCDSLTGVVTVKSVCDDCVTGGELGPAHGTSGLIH